MRSKTTIEPVQLKTSPRRNKLSIKNKIKNISKLAFDPESKSNTNSTLETYMFGDIAAVIELYNTFVPHYNKKAQAKLKSESSMSQDDQNELTEIDYDSFVNIFSDYSGTGKEYFVKIMRSLLKIFIRNEKIFGVLV